jgi:D-aminoacyl-tRNA deacylase
MRIALISSTIDPASVNIKEQLLDDYEFVRLENKFEDNDVYGYLVGNKDIKLYTIDTELIFTDDLDKKIEADVFVFLSKHKAADGRASLTCHPIGNFNGNEKGGKENTLCVCASSLLKEILIELSKNVEGSEYEATLESTHHGPFMAKPLLFFELGSTEKHWNDKNGAKIYVKTLMNVLGKFNDKEKTIKNNFNDKKTMDNDFKNNNYKKINNDSGNKVVFVIGGSHYNHVANKVMLNTNYTVGHICPKFNLENLNEEMLKQAMEKSNSKFVLLDWKGLGKEKQRILDLLEKNNIKFKRSDKFFE